MAADSSSDRHPPLEGLHEAALYTDDLEAAERFFAALGFPRVGYAEDRHVFFRAGRDLLLVFNPETTSQSGGAVPPHGTRGPGHIALSVPDLDALEKWRVHLTAGGVPIEAEVEWPAGGRSLYFRDPAGNSLELITRGSWGF